MKNYLTIVFILLGLTIQAQNDTAFIYTYGGAADDEGKDIIQTADNGYLIVGSTSSFGNGNSDIYALKLDSNFQVEWSNSYGGPQIDIGETVLAADDGGYYLIGYTNSFGSGGYDVYLVKIEADGTKEWDDYYGGANWDFAYDAVLTPKKELLIVGETYSFGAGDAQAYVLKLDAFGSILWEKSYGGSTTDLARSVCITSDSSYVFVGETDSASLGLDLDAWIVKLDSNGNTLMNLNIGRDFDDGANSVIESSDSGIVFIGYSKTGSNDLDLYLAKLNKNGDFLWDRIHGSSNALDDIGYDLRETTDKFLVLCGYTKNYGSGQEDMYTLQTSFEGLWRTAPSYGGRRTDISYKTLRTANNKDLFMGKSNSYTTAYYDVAIVIADTVDGNKKLEHTSFVDTSQSSNPQLSVTVDKPTEPYSFIQHSFYNTSDETLRLSAYDLAGRLVLQTNVAAGNKYNLEQFIGELLVFSIQSNSSQFRITYFPQ